VNATLRNLQDFYDAFSMTDVHARGGARGYLVGGFRPDRYAGGRVIPAAFLFPCRAGCYVDYIEKR
jgi:hypothetical protein